MGSGSLAEFLKHMSAALVVMIEPIRRRVRQWKYAKEVLQVATPVLGLARKEERDLARLGEDSPGAFVGRVLQMVKRTGRLLQVNRGGYFLLLDTESRHSYHFWITDVLGYSGQPLEEVGLVPGAQLRFDADYVTDSAKNVEVLTQ